MKADKFRAMALSLPETVESSHMNHPDFRVGGRVFATLSQDDKWGMVKLSPTDQESLMTAAPDVYVPAKGAWGRQGCTMVCLQKAKVASVRMALLIAWRHTAPAALRSHFDAS